MQRRRETAASYVPFGFFSSPEKLRLNGATVAAKGNRNASKSLDDVTCLRKLLSESESYPLDVVRGELFEIAKSHLVRNKEKSAEFAWASFDRR